MKICKDCKHKEICKYRKDCEQLQMKMMNEQKLLENQAFCIEIDCKYFDGIPTAKSYSNK